MGAALPGLFLFVWSGTAITIVAKFIEQINTPSPNTKTIDDDGERGDNTQLFFYHGTSKKRADIIRRNGFQISTDGMLGPGVYVSNQIEKAKHYATYTGNRDGDNGAVLVLEVRLGNVKKINYQGKKKNKKKKKTSKKKRFQKPRQSKNGRYQKIFPGR